MNTMSKDDSAKWNRGINYGYMLYVDKLLQFSSYKLIISINQSGGCNLFVYVGL